jgi:hypothetical protein
MGPSVLKRLERLSADIERLRKDVDLLTPDAKHANAIDDQCSDIIEAAARIAAEARTAAGNTSGAGLVTRIRKALGFTQP